jgi:hypothetical protein
MATKMSTYLGSESAGRIHYYLAYRIFRITDPWTRIRKKLITDRKQCLNVDPDLAKGSGPATLE